MSSTTFTVKRDGSHIKDWFMNSWENMIKDVDLNVYRWLDGPKLYEHLYNVKLHTNKNVFSESVISVEFPSEEEATMFMLRWS